MKAWLPTDCTLDEVDAMVHSPDWMLQEKVDGMRLIVMRQNSQDDTLVRTFNRHGEPYRAPDWARVIFEKLPDGLYDGELLIRTRRYILFEIIGSSPSALGRWQAALAVVQANIWGWGHDLLSIVRCAVTVKDKEATEQALHKWNAEGMIFKRIDAPYTPGRPITGGTMRRFKFRKTADVILQRRPDPTDTTRSLEMWVFEEGQPVHVGTVNANRGDDRGHYYDQLAPGEITVGEVSYLYMTDTSKLVQSTIVRLRDDKNPEDCLFCQLETGGRFAHQ